MATTPNAIITPQAVRNANAVCTAAKTTYGDNTNLVAIMSAGANGAVLYKLTAVPRATLGSAAQLQLYRARSSDPTAATPSLINMATMAAYTMATTTSPVPTDFGYSETVPLRILASETLWVASAVALAGGIVFDAQWEDL